MSPEYDLVSGVGWRVLLAPKSVCAINSHARTACSCGYGMLQVVKTCDVEHGLKARNITAF